MGRGFEMAITPVVFGGLGWLLDRAFGTGVILTIAFAVFGVVGMMVRYWIGYDADMRRQEDKLLGRTPRSDALDASAAPSHSADTAASA